MAFSRKYWAFIFNIKFHTKFFARLYSLNLLQFYEKLFLRQNSNFPILQKFSITFDLENKSSIFRKKLPSKFAKIVFFYFLSRNLMPKKQLFMNNWLISKDFSWFISNFLLKQPEILIIVISCMQNWVWSSQNWLNVILQQGKNWKSKWTPGEQILDLSIQNFCHCSTFFQFWNFCQFFYFL